jgi:2-oxoglutarate/2-oxoacid ferredoxin oxidoreductase subunit beta
MNTELNTCSLTKADFVSDQAVKWCPGCGDYAILTAVQNALPRIGKKKEDIVFVSGIGCSSRFPYYMSAYGFHTIHGRAAAIASGVKLANPELCVWEITGDGDALAIGGNHLIHLLRRNIDINILLFNNKIYGLTKGQFSPTTEIGSVTKSSPQEKLKEPFLPGALSLGARANFFARITDANPKTMAEVFVAAALHKGTSLVEILQNCVIFNDGVHDAISSKETRDDNQIYLEHGKPMLFGKTKNKGIRLNGLKLEAVTIGENGITEKDILIHDASEADPTMHFMLVRMSLPELPVAMGVIRSVEVKTYNDQMKDQLALAKSKSKFENLNEFFGSGDVWEIKS